MVKSVPSSTGKEAGTNKPWAVFLLAAVMASLVLAGCAGGSSADSQSDRKTEAGNTASAGMSEEMGERSAPAAGSVQTNEDAASATLMIYMVGSDLESGFAAATEDIQEMLNAKIDLEQNTVLLYTGGTTKWHTDISAENNMIYKITGNSLLPVSGGVSVSMGEADTLTGFLNYSYEQYPSDSYDLIFWNHGSGPMEGFGKDSLYDNDQLTLVEIRDALEASPFSEDNKLSFVGFDACLMSSLEAACVLDEYADYLVASQETEPGFGWNYSFLSELGSVDTETFLREIVDSYLFFGEAYYTGQNLQGPEMTLSVLDLSAAEAVEKSVNELFTVDPSKLAGEYFALAGARVKTRGFGRSTTGSEYDLVDLAVLADEMEELSSREAAKVKEHLEKLVFYHQSNMDESCGISLYYPFYNKRYYERKWGDTYRDLGVLVGYAKYLENYSRIWLGVDMKSLYSDTLEAEESGHTVYTLRLTEEQAETYAEGGYYILRKESEEEDLYSMIYSSSDISCHKGKITAEFDGRVIYCTNETGEQFIPAVRERDTIGQKTYYSVTAALEHTVEEQLTQPGIIVSMGLVLDHETKELSIAEITDNHPAEEELQGGKNLPVELSEYAHAEFYTVPPAYLTRDEEGRISDYWNWKEKRSLYGWDLLLSEGLEFVYEPLVDDGSDYFFMFYVKNLQGDTFCSEPLPIRSFKSGSRG
ncbi:MAG: clostripain-related cysteine peptidase [Lachnospiraceae bacterium]|nr:clostripain-related cysteine peptidase [Lachnospiraceae bacterium]